jgi:uncharacterized protein involved in outer membrane biogenesis
LAILSDYVNGRLPRQWPKANRIKMRKLLIGLVAVLVIVVSAALVIPSFIDWNSYKAEIAAQAKAATGRNLVIDGDLNFTILPEPRLSVAGVHFANLKGGSAGDMVRLKSLDVRVRFAPLLKGKIDIETVRLVEPVILLERLKDGRVNWQLGPVSGNPGAIAGGPANTARQSGSGVGSGAIRLDNLLIEKGTLIWRDAVAGSTERITDLSMALTARSLNGPFSARGSLSYKGIKSNLEASIGEVRAGAAAQLSISLALPDSGAKADVLGSVVALGAPPKFSGKIDVNGKDLAKMISALAGSDIPLALAQPFRLRAKIQASDRSASVDQLDLELAGARLSGTIKASLTGRPNVDAKIHITRIDLDSLLGASPGGTGSVAGVRAPPTAAGRAKETRGETQQFALPNFDGSLDLGIDALTYNRRNMRGVVIRAELAQGEAKLTKASMFLPGGGEASMIGTLAVRGGKPAYAAGISARADNFRALLDWLGIDAASVPGERLRRFTLTSQIKGDDQQLQMLNSKIVLDTTQIDGAITLALRDRLAFGATVAVDKIDVDAYFPPPGQGAGPIKKPAAKPVTSKGPAAAADSKTPLSVLDRFDANIRLRVGRLTYRKTPVRDIRFDGTVSGGSLAIKKASVADLAGVRAAIAGTLLERAGLPVFKGTVSADARDISGALRLAGITPPDSVRALGAFKLRGKADAGADKADLDITMNAAGATVKLAAKVSGLDKIPHYDATLTAEHKDLAKLLRAVGTEIQATRLGRFGLTARATGGINALSANIRVNAAGGVVVAKGTGRGLATQPVFDVVVNADHPEIGKLIRSFSPEYRSKRGAIGPLKLGASLKGAKGVYAVRKLDVQAGNLSLAGSGDLKTRGIRPFLTASLTAGKIDLNPFLSDRTAGSGGGFDTRSGSGGKRSPSANGSGRFSDQRFDTAPLGLIDADLSIKATKLLYRQFTVDYPSIRTTLKDRLLVISEITGKMFEGAFKLTGDLDGRAAPRIKGEVMVSKANVSKALFKAEVYDLQGGITDFNLKVAGNGASPRRLLASLNGDGRLSSRNGSIKGFDLKAVNDRLKNLDGGLDFLSLIGTAMGGGQTKFSKLDGTFKIKKGVLRTNDIRLVADAGEGTASGYADLPRWLLDFNGQFRLPEHPKAPPFKMRAIGPIDNPKRLFDFQQLQSYVVSRGFGSLLRKVLPRGLRGSSSPSQPQQQPQSQQQQPKAPRLEDLLPGIFDRIRR